MVKKLIAFRGRKFIACHSNLNNASVLWCTKKSRMRVLMPQEIKTIGYEKVRMVVGVRKGGGVGWQTKCIMGDVQMANIQRLMYRALANLL